MLHYVPAWFYTFLILSTGQEVHIGPFPDESTCRETRMTQLRPGDQAGLCFKALDVRGLASLGREHTRNDGEGT